MRIDANIEITETLRAGWAWRCHACDLTTANLTQQETKVQVDTHLTDPAHLRAARQVTG